MDHTGSYAISRRARALFTPPPPSTLALIVSTGEEQAPTAGPGKPPVWRRWIEVRIVSGEGVSVFRADARALAVDAVGADYGKGEILSQSFDPLCAEHFIRRRGADHVTTEPASAELRRIAIEICRAVALRLHGFGVDRAAVARPWLEGRPAFAAIVQGAPSRGATEGCVAPEMQPYPQRKVPRKGKLGASSAVP